MTQTGVLAAQSATYGGGIPSPSISEIMLGPVPLRAYALAIIVGIVLGAWIGSRRYAARGGDPDVLVDMLLYAVPAGIIGARFYHVFTSPERYFGQNGRLIDVVKIWEGGLGIWGAIPAGALVAWWYLHRKGLRFSTLADALAPGILVAQAVGRLGNYFNQELYGGPTDLPWGLQIDNPPVEFAAGTLFHPTFLYELVWNLAAALLLVWWDRRRRLGNGQVFWLYVVFYSLGRGWIEMLRIDDATIIGGLRLNVWTSIILFVLGAAFYVRSRRLHPEREPSPTFDADADDRGLIDHDSQVVSDRANDFISHHKTPEEPSDSALDQGADPKTEGQTPTDSGESSR